MPRKSKKCNSKLLKKEEEGEKDDEVVSQTKTSIQTSPRCSIDWLAFCSENASLAYT